MSRHVTFHDIQGGSDLDNRFFDQLRARFPKGLVKNARFVFLVFTLAAVGVIGAQIAFGSSGMSAGEGAALVVIGLLVWRWISWQRSGRMRSLDLLLESGLILALAAATGDPLAAMGTLFLMVFYRAFFSTLRQLILGFPLTVGAFLISVEVANHPDIAMGDPEVLLRAPFFVFAAFLGYMFAGILHRSEAAQLKYEALVGQAGDAIFLRDEKGTILEVNEHACESLGYTPDELVGMSILDIEVGIDREELIRNMTQRLPSEQYTLEGRQRRKDGTTFPVEVRTGPVHLGDDTIFMAIVRDVTEREQLEQRLTHQAFHDSLTELPNRALFEERLEHALRRLDRTPGRLAVMFLDLDNFKIVNDSLDHQHGDELLKVVARRLTGAVRPGDTVARMGGDEFTILLEDIDGADEALAISERMEALMRKEIEVGGFNFSVGASIGIALHSESGMTYQELTRRADVAMYEAKAGGKGGSILMYNTNLQREVRKRVDIETSLRGALEREELTLQYQPILNLSTSEVSEIEALLRWDHPERGLLDAGEFLPLAESSGIVTQVDVWMLHRACSQMAQWKRDYDEFSDVTIAVNVSEQLLRDPRIVDIVSRTLQETNLEPRWLKLEVNERTILNDVSNAAESLKVLHDLGVRIAVDDFGTANSTFNYLRRVPIESLKIDRSFIEGFQAGTREADMLAALAQFADSMGMSITAEGIDGTQHRALWAHGCHHGQGHWFRAPANAGEIVATLVGSHSDVSRRDRS